MLHEILLSLSGHPSPLLTADHSSPTSILSPPEKALLESIARLSDLHRTLLTHTATIASSHPSSICQAVATAIRSTHLAAFQRKVLEVEDGILRKDAGSVGAYNIVPLTAIVGQFSGWMRRMEWFVEVVKVMMRGGKERGKKCSGAMIIDWLCDALHTGYVDIEEAALGLVRVAETAWLKQVSGWVLYGRLPGVGREDFCVQMLDGDVEEYELQKELLPAFVSSTTAGSLLFIGRSLNHIRARALSSSTAPELDLVSSNLKLLSTLKFPLGAANFSRVITSIRLSLSQTTLKKLLPTSKVIEVLSLLRQFFLLGRGEFAIALIAEADEKIRSRWQRSDNLAYEKRDGLGNIALKEGEVSAVLARTWAAMRLLQGRDEDQDEDEILELARDLVQLVITKSSSTTPSKGTPSSSQVAKIAATPFRNLLLSVPVVLTMHIPSPLDLFLTPSDVQIYSSINAYLFSIRRAHLRLTDLWKISSLRRDHPSPPGPPYGSSKSGRNKVLTLRQRAKERSMAMRSVWATSSAAVFFLGETEAYLQGEVVEGTWNGFKSWLTAEETAEPSKPAAENDEDDDIWMRAGRESTPNTNTGHTHDPQSLSEAHRRYLAALTSSLLLTTPAFTDPLFHLLQQIDHLVALVHRIHAIWQSLDLEADEGVVDAFSDFHKEEADVRAQLIVIAGRVKSAIGELVKGLRDVDQEKEGWDSGFQELVLGEEGVFVPKKVGRVDRLLMKLDFGGWFDGGAKVGSEEGEDDDDDGL
ncbi:Spindle pole body component [Venustampulla echinocandica]|uniref:Spindle pole body component n=1 Tax=Venustampulla echinocandica TaxID=2656787 RepID=A0A370TCM1_9HELO|nr:Spindle pole body component [Venustampulla echinocandica]RDL31981.1 Spindle pole body component [Venustampulla echinocandica]